MKNWKMKLDHDFQFYTDDIYETEDLIDNKNYMWMFLRLHYKELLKIFDH